jgi:hypothetical protein
MDSAFTGRRVLLFATTTGYQTRAFGDAAARLGVELIFATDRCHLLEDPWQDSALPIRFSHPAGSTAAILAAAATTRFDGILAVGDRPTVIASQVAAGLGLPWHPPAAAAAARNKRLTREHLRAAGLAVPWFGEYPVEIEVQRLVPSLAFPCVIKPLALSGSRGVMRVNDGDELRIALSRLRTMLELPEIRAERDEAHRRILIEGFISGREYALEGLMNHGVLDVLAIFDKPDPLDGPFFEETLYVTPSVASAAIQRALIAAVAKAAAALGLFHGPIHAECRADGDMVFVLEVASRPIGGLCSRALRFQHRDRLATEPIALEELLLRHALGESSRDWRRETGASGVLMIPIPRRGIYRGVSGIAAAKAVAGIDDVRITAKPDQILVPLPDGASYLGFVFAHAGDPAEVQRALRHAHAQLQFSIDTEVRMLQSAHG